MRFCPKPDKLHKINIVYIKSRRMRWARHVARMEERRSSFKISTSKPEGNRLLGRPRHRWEDSIRMDLKEICVTTRNWVDSSQDRDYWRALVNVALNLQVPKAMELVS